MGKTPMRNGSWRRHVDDSKLTLYMKHETATKLHEEAKAAEIERMAAKAQQEQERINNHRGKQEQALAARAAKRLLEQDAKLCEQLLTEACKSLEDAQDARISARSDNVNLKSQLHMAQTKLADAQQRLHKAVDRHTMQTAIVGDLQALLEDALKPTAPGIVEERSQKLREAWTNSRAAWDKIQKAVFKKEHDRALKKRAKGLLGL